MISTTNYMKYVIVSGGVMSGIGKGIVASSTGMLLRSCGFNVTHIKIDPYLNIDAGTMSPYEHGEVFILDDGGEVDLDLGNYERFVGLTLTKDHNITTGKIYNSVIQKERRGDYLGKTVQVIPHITNEIQETIQRVAEISTDGSSQKPDICVIELGGTVGDIESMPFIEALHQLRFKVKKENFCLLHVCLAPMSGDEQKTKPIQRSVSELRSLGLTADFVICRCAKPINTNSSEKIAQFCNISESNVISVHDVSNLYRVPLILMDQRLPIKLLTHFGFTPSNDFNLTLWSQIAQTQDDLNIQCDKIKIVIAGKYTGLSDAYHSIVKAIQHASLHTGIKTSVIWVETTELEESHKIIDLKKYEIAWNHVKSANGILIPGGYGDRGIEGMILAANYARLNKVPYFGICLGMQIAVIEYARNVLGWTNATSEEFASFESLNVIIAMPEISKTIMGGTMRLGVRNSHFKKPCLVSKLYEKIWGNVDVIAERHRHRYEVNPSVVDAIEVAGLNFVAQDDMKIRQEIIELSNQFYIGVQYHPEMKTTQFKPSPPFVGFVLAAADELIDFLDGKRKLGVY